MLKDKIVDEYGTIRYYKDNKLHREDGPAIEWWDGTKFWWLNGERHREDGPAIEFSDGTKSWWLNDIKYKEKNYWIKLQELQLGMFKPFFSKEEFKV